MCHKQRLCIFAGTTEGRQLVEALVGQPVEVLVSVATQYGEALLPQGENIAISTRRLTQQDMVALFQQNRPQLVIDATHPYATAVTAAIQAACQETATGYVRLQRQSSAMAQEAVYVSSPQEAVDYLSHTEGHILLTTGSKELDIFSSLPDFSQRVYARVLPMEASLAACQANGLPPAHILALQGPFSQAMNAALLEFTKARWLVTKDGGAAGGFAEKQAAARQTGAQLVVIGRPPVHQEGVSLEDVLEQLSQMLATAVALPAQGTAQCKALETAVSSSELLNALPSVSIAGIGPGSRQAMTVEVQQALQQARCIIGARRMVEAVAQPDQQRYEAISPQEIARYIQGHPQQGPFVVVLSGDVGFYSGAKKLLPLLQDYHPQVLPGLSSLVYLCSRLGLSYEDVYVTSTHGRQHSIVPDVQRHRQVFALTGGQQGVQQLCQQLTEAGLGQVQVTVGQRLSYPDEAMVQGTAAALAQGTYEPLSAVLIQQEKTTAIVTAGLPDGLFQRSQEGAAVVPMTKSEVRAICLSRLQLTADAICWDLGAGTGSVAIEMALQARDGHVYAVERRQDAVALLQQNQRAFFAENLTVVAGTAPEACEGLPAPTHVFIGGSAGQLQQMIAAAVAKNPQVRIVATAIALETVAALTHCINTMDWAETEVISVQVAREKQAGPYHLMTGQNPVYIVTMQAGGGQ